MKRILLVLIALVEAAVLSGQIRTIPTERLMELYSPALSADSTALAFDSSILDAGTLCSRGEAIELEFRFTNVSDREFRISRVLSSCDCSKPDWPEDPVAPGQRAGIRITYDPKGHLGRFERRFMVYGENDEEKPAAMLILKVRVVEDLKDNPL